MQNKWWDFTEESTKMGDEFLDHILEQSSIGENLCSRCKRNEAEYDHRCPYQSDMNGDRDFTCNCCNDCYSNCLGDI